MNESLISDYVLKHYPRRFKDKPIIITELDSIILVKTHKTESPLILSKGILA